VRFVQQNFTPVRMDAFDSVVNLEAEAYQRGFAEGQVDGAQSVRTSEFNSFLNSFLLVGPEGRN
jgi:hypothetical protein